MFDHVKTALEANGFIVEVVGASVEARAKIKSLIPANAEVMVMSSVTLETIGVKDLDTVRERLKDNRKLGSVPDYALGSVHAVTEDGKLVIASNTGSQLPAYAFGSNHVIFVVGKQKIVKDLDAAFKRIYDYVLPLESERANKAYNITTGSFVSKLLIINKEIQPQRITIILVNAELGF